MSVINFPILYIPDPTKGRPLFNGQIFVGIPDLDPEVVINQKQLNVIQEDGTVVPVDQPFFLSSGGVPIYQNQTVRLDVAGNYSLKILDNLGAQKYLIENVFEGEPVTQADIDRLKPDTLAIWQADTSALADDVITTKEFATGDGGGADYDVIAGTGTANTADKIAHGTLSLTAVYRPEPTVKISQIGGNSTSTSAATMTALATFTTVEFDVETKKTGTYFIPANQKIIFSANVIQNDDTFSFVGNAIGWSLAGSGKIHRAAGLPVSFIANSIGLLISSTAFGWSISGDIRIEHFAGSGITLNGSDILVPPVSRSKISGLTCHENAQNWEILAGFPAEYVSIVNCYATDGTVVGVLEEAGNVNWVGGTISGNKGGVHLRQPVSGANPHHGMFVGVHINHNIDFQVHAEIVALGYDFSACHFFDNADPSTGRIILDSCRGINITGGTIGCNVAYTDTNPITANIGMNRISGNKMEAAAAIVTGIGFDRTKLFVEGNFDISGDWLFNDSSRLHGLIRAQANEVITGSTSYNLVVLLGAVGGGTNILADNRDAFTTGNFVVPWFVDLITRIGIDFTFSQALIGSEILTISRDDSGGGTFSTLFTYNFLNASWTTALQSTITASHRFPVSSGGQMSVFISGFSAANSITIKEGAFINFDSQN